MSTEPGEMMGIAGPGMLAGLRVIEIADERAEYAGLLLAGLGAEVIKIERPEGNATRRIGPFLDDEPGLERSLFFWNYNRNKKSVVLDRRDKAGQQQMLRLLGGADILLDASCGALNEALGLAHAALNARFPALVAARMTPFGDDGPWKDFKGSDLIHLALGGPMMNCGYDPDPNLEYDTPPIAPQIWHAYHIAGEQMATGILAALIHRERSGEARSHMLDVVQRFVRAWTYKDMPWREAQDAGLLWAPLRKPHENALDEHWLTRKTFAQIEHPELGRSFLYPTSKWLASKTSWQVGRRAPLLGEDTEGVLGERARRPSVPASPRKVENPRLSALHNKPFPLQGIRIFDFAWFLASAGATRFLAALGAESYKVEWKDNPDTRLAGMAPVGGRAARDAATGPLRGVKDPDMGGKFLHKNSGKRGISLNIRHPKGLEIAKDMIRICDVVAEGFSPGVLQRLGLGYDVMKSIRPDIIYIQQSGMGAHGTYGRMRTVGPVAAAFGGQAEMSGLAEPAMPVSWGYSYLDWMGAYGYALALLGAIYHRALTGEGQWIDASQCESGIFLTGATILDWAANERVFRRFGNPPPYKPAAPPGAYRCAGKDRWIAIACFTDAEWHALARVAEQGAWLDDARLATLEQRLLHQDSLDAAVEAWTRTQDPHDCMIKLQRAGVPAGACQNAEDRVDSDPQLRHLKWLTEVTGTKVGTWPVYEIPMKMTKTPAYIGGPINRGAPCYGEDNMYVLTELLGRTPSEVERLAEEGVI